jgi:hypothetical protein
MEALNSILKKFIKDLGLESGIILNTIRNQWNEIVGQTIAAHTFPETIKGRVLTLLVDTPQWMHHLSFYKEEIIQKLKPYNMTGVRFKLGRLPERSNGRQEEDNPILTEDDQRYIENTLRNIEDEELKEKLRTLLIHGLTRGKQKT